MIYILQNKKMPWGDYGEILWQGIYYFNKKKQEHCILRTAPFCPPLYRSQYDREYPVIIVKEQVKKLIEKNFLHFNFVKVCKDKIVKLNWQDWDLSKDEPEIYPSADMDAEEYITNKKHNEVLSQGLGNLYALIPEKDGYSYYDEKDAQEKLVKSTLSTKDIFITHSLKAQEIYVSEKLKLFLETNFPGDIYFEPALFGEPEDVNKLAEKFLHLDVLKEKSEKMSDNDWSKWHKLKGEAQRLIEGIDSLKTETAKNKRKEKIHLLLNEANEIYPLNTENWMCGFWGVKVTTD
ncbi:MULTISPECIES: hypothetical protein [unclassified Treponema]|uniref:hypothetical protein n=1 Tax=unclassified Treponema TaxID=2638727 RepID=UPI0020A5AED4|nr:MULTISPECIES: hypothetical protein [unclassified Treponema]UTC66795.1 hypothetical protein E4O06_12735 [Treponema sp. OMZ 789]UTC69528.1 hypothetical protein E4O01_12875 [Treponema sp. OMZ 790]UTC72242.1 hypothetical protein E4O02_12970 [Treponema sp. OMZ 791]